EVLEKNFADDKEAWEPVVKEMVPTYGRSLINDEKLMRETRRETSKNLHLNR
ncbi:malate:quinone oxidoreductase, partial [Staphylococcus epidermidis]